MTHTKEGRRTGTHGESRRNLPRASAHEHQPAPGMRLARWLALLLLLLSLPFGTDAAAAPGREVRVVVIDIADAIRFGTPSGQSEHGQIVAEIVRRECPQCRIEMLLIADGLDYYRALAEVLETTETASLRRSGAILVNISLGHANSSLMEGVVLRLLKNAGVLVVAAAGNEGTDEPVFPAADPDVVAVAGIEYRWQLGWPLLAPRKASYSSFGPHVSLAAKAGYADTDITANVNGPQIVQTLAEGSSFAAPRVVGLLGKLLLANDRLTPAEALEIVRKTATPFPDDPFYASGNLGAGVIDAEAAMAIANPGLAPSVIGAVVARADDLLKESGGYVAAMVPVAAVLFFLFWFARSQRPFARGVKATVDAAEMLVELTDYLGVETDPDLVASRIRAVLPGLEYHVRDSGTSLELENIVHYLGRHNAGGRFNDLLERLRELQRY